MYLLDIQNCTVRYPNGTDAVSDVSLSIGEGEIVSIVGESGSGKTTLIRAILGLLPPGGKVAAGRILFDGKDLARISQREMQCIRGKDIAIIFQDVGAALDPIQKIRRQYAEAICVHERCSKPACHSLAVDMLRRMHLADSSRIMDSYPFELSGGMKQRVGIAMAMTARPKLLLADEPTSALDVTIQAQVVYQLRQLRKQYGTAIILVTHNMGVASYLSDRIGVMRDGKLVEFGLRDEIIYHPKKSYTRSLLEVVPKLGGNRLAK